MVEGYKCAHIADVKKIAYGTTTWRCVGWMHEHDEQNPG